MSARRVVLWILVSASFIGSAELTPVLAEASPDRFDGQYAGCILVTCKRGGGCPSTHGEARFELKNGRLTGELEACGRTFPVSVQVGTKSDIGFFLHTLTCDRGTATLKSSVSDEGLEIDADNFIVKVHQVVRKDGVVENCFNQTP